MEAANVTVSPKPQITAGEQGNLPEASRELPLERKRLYAAPTTTSAAKLHEMCWSRSSYERKTATKEPNAPVYELFFGR